MHRSRSLGTTARAFSAPKTGNSAKWRDNGDGYMVRMARTEDGKYIKVWQHRVVMEEHLGRPLRKNENVHHLNGVRHDNRLENLELWVTRQPAGQRPADLVVWAREILERYEDDVESKKL